MFLTVYVSHLLSQLKESKFLLYKVDFRFKLIDIYLIYHVYYKNQQTLWCWYFETQVGEL